MHALVWKRKPKRTKTDRGGYCRAMCAAAASTRSPTFDVGPTPHIPDFHERPWPERNHAVPTDGITGTNRTPLASTRHSVLFPPAHKAAAAPAFARRAQRCKVCFAQHTSTEVLNCRENGLREKTVAVWHTSPRAAPRQLSLESRRRERCGR